MPERSQDCPLTPKSRFLTQDSVVFTDIKNQGIILNLKNNNFYTLNETATRIWKSLKKRKTIKEITDEFIQKYECSKNKVTKSIKRQIREFLTQGLIKYV